MKIKTWFEELSEDQHTALTGTLEEVDDLQIYWFVQDSQTIVVEGELFSVNNDPSFTIAQLQHIVEEAKIKINHTIAEIAIHTRKQFI